MQLYLSSNVDTQEKYIRIGFFDNFRGEDSVLISVDIHGLLQLEELFDKLANNCNSFKIGDLEYIDKEYSLNITLLCDNYNYGLTEIEPNVYEWRVTKEKWANFRIKARALYLNSDKCHNYLDSDSIENNDLQVILSLNEYNLNFWEKHL